MIFLNKKIPIINTYQKDNPYIDYQMQGVPTDVMNCLNNYDNNLKVWYCLITTENSLSIFDIKNLMGLGFFNKLLNKEISLLIDLSFEPFLKCIDMIYESVVLKYNIDPSQIIFVSNMYDASDYNKKVADSLNVSPMRIIWIPTLEFMINSYARRRPSVIPKNTLKIKEYNKKFLNLNRRWRNHRPLLILLLNHFKLLNSGLVSFGPCENHNSWNKIMDGLKVSALDNPEMLKIILKNENTISNIPFLYLDVKNLSINQPFPTDTTNKYYEDSYFSLISETTFYNRDTFLNSRFLTEKTFKAILCKHPFILVTLPNSLTVLKELGYKTFEPLIDESYDLELDDNKRMMMIVKEVQRLCNLNQKDLNYFLLAVKKITLYNYNVLLSKKNFIYEK